MNHNNTRRQSRNRAWHSVESRSTAFTPSSRERSSPVCQRPVKSSIPGVLVECGLLALPVAVALDDQFERGRLQPVAVLGLSPGSSCSGRCHQFFCRSRSETPRTTFAAGISTAQLREDDRSRFRSTICDLSNTGVPEPEGRGLTGHCTRRPLLRSRAAAGEWQGVRQPAAE